MRWVGQGVKVMGGVRWAVRRGECKENDWGWGWVRRRGDGWGRV